MYGDPRLSDLGFVHQVLSFSRLDDASITSSIVRFAPYALDRYIITQRYASVFVEPKEASFLRRRSSRVYYRVLAKAAIQLREPAYWRYHRLGLKVLKQTINWPYLVLRVGLMSLWLALNPGMTAIAAMRSWNRRRHAGSSNAGDSVHWARGEPRRRRGGDKPQPSRAR